MAQNYHLTLDNGEFGIEKRCESMVAFASDNAFSN